MSPENIHKAVLESMEHAYVFYNLAGEIAAYNRAACQILGLTPSQIEGKTSFDPDWNTIREDGSDFPPHLHPIMVSLKKGTPCFGVVMGVTTGGGAGSLRWLLINSDVIRDEETKDIAGAIASFSDITQQINQKKYLERSLKETRLETQTSEHNAEYLLNTVRALICDIADSGRRVLKHVERTEPDAEILEDARRIAVRTEKLASLLAPKKRAESNAA